MIIAKQSTARTVTVGPILDADGVAVTGGVVADMKISKNGGAPAALNGSATLTHRHTGFYSLALTASDLDTVGQAEVVIDDTVNAMPMKEITVLEEAIYDALFAASANAFSGAAGSTTLTALASGSITAAVIATGAIDADAIADNAIDAGAIAADAITAAKIADGAIDAATFAAGAITAAAIANGAIDAATFAADVDAEILSYLVDDATRIDASQLNTHTAITAAGIADQVWEEAIADHSGTAGSTAEALNAAGSAGDPWTTQLPGAYGAGSAGKIIGDNVNATISSRASQTSVDDLPTNAELTTALASADDAVLAAIAGLNDIAAADVWAVATRTLTAGTNIQLPANGLANVTTWTVAITGNITGNLSGSVGSVTGAVGSVTGSVGSVTGTVGGIAGTTTTLDSLQTALSTAHGAGSWATATSVTVSDKTGFSLAATGLNLVVPADPSAIPVLGTSSIVSWIGYFGAWSVNEVNSTSSEVELRNSADNAALATHTTSDDGTTFSSSEPV